MRDLTLSRTLLSALAALLLLAAPACARVKPYQREQHAARSMQDRGELESKLDEHVHEYREGSTGGRGQGSGGCGCN